MTLREAQSNIALFYLLWTAIMWVLETWLNWNVQRTLTIWCVDQLFPDVAQVSRNWQQVGLHRSHHGTTEPLPSVL